MIYFRSSDRQTHALLIETKSVIGDKVNLSIMPKQVQGIKSYCAAIKQPFVYAIYWEKFRVWTLNTPDQFSARTSEWRIRFEEAYTTDLSSILGDETIIFARPLVRRSTFERRRESGIQHQKYGSVESDELSSDGATFLKLEPLESALIDSSITFKEIRKSSNGSRTELYEESAAGYMLRLTTLVPRHLSIGEGIKLQEDSVRVSLRTIQSVAAKFAAVVSVGLPKCRTSDADYLLEQAFGGGDIWKSYERHHSAAQTS